MDSFITGLYKLFAYYKQLGEKTMEQLSDEQLFLQPNPESNSIALIVQHLSGNMRSRFTDFLTSDGEKSWRNRDAEFEPLLHSRSELEAAWHQGWNCLFQALATLSEADLNQTVYIRNQGHSVSDALHRQLAHYAYHVGQMVFVGKLYAGSRWTSLSIPKGQSDAYNSEKFAADKSQQHFTDQYLHNPNDPAASLSS